jgi:hypothetical protein
MTDVGNGKDSEFKAQISNALSSLNGAGGEFIPTTAMFQNDGGYTARQTTNNAGITPEQMKQAMKEAVREVKVITTVEDYRKADANYTKIQDRSNY